MEAFPQDLPHQIEMDVSAIQTLNDVIFIKDLKIPSKVEVIDDLELPVITVMSLSEDAIEPEETEAPVAEETPAPDSTEEKTE